LYPSSSVLILVLSNSTNDSVFYSYFSSSVIGIYGVSFSPASSFVVTIAGVSYWPAVSVWAASSSDSPPSYCISGEAGPSSSLSDS
jgi:hypothetical protein